MRRIGRREMTVEARAVGEPRPNLRMFMGSVVVHDDVDVEFCRDVALEVVEEGQELLMAVTWFALSDDGAGGNIERGKQGRGVVPWRK